MGLNQLGNGFYKTMHKINTPPAVDDAPAISILMPVYNVEEFIESAVQSLLTQTFEDFELLVMDDGSTDSTLAKLNKLAARDPRLKVFERPNRKVAACLNELATIAQGQFVARMDGDDIAHPRRLEKQYDYLKHRKDPVVVGSWVQTFGQKVERWHYRRWDNYSRNLLFFGVTILSHPTWMMSRELLLKYPYDDDYRFIIDREWLARVALACPELKFEAIPEVLLDYRIHENSVSGQYSEAQLAKTRRVINKYLEGFEIKLNEKELSLFEAVSAGAVVDYEQVFEAGRVVEFVSEKAKTKLSDDFFVFREKWLHFCFKNNARDMASQFLNTPGFVFLIEKPSQTCQKQHPY